MKKLVWFWRFVLFALAIPLLVSNCMETAQTNKAVVPGQSRSALASGENALADATATGDYRIGSRDILQVAVFQVQDLNNTVQVGEDGNVTLALVGTIQLRGKMTYEADQRMAS